MWLAITVSTIVKYCEKGFIVIYEKTLWEGNIIGVYKKINGVVIVIYYNLAKIICRSEICVKTQQVFKNI